MALHNLPFFEVVELVPKSELDNLNSVQNNVFRKGIGKNANIIGDSSAFPKLGNSKIEEFIAPLNKKKIFNFTKSIQKEFKTPSKSRISLIVIF